jgi:hypothetical protein
VRRRENVNGDKREKDGKYFRARTRTRIKYKTKLVLQNTSKPFHTQIFIIGKKENFRRNISIGIFAVTRLLKDEYCRGG